MEKVNLRDAFASFDETWSPRLAARVDDHAVKLAKIEGEFVWHAHPDADELFLVVDGTLRLRLRDREDVVLRAGELFVVPRGVEHQPVAEGVCQIAMFEREDVPNTGDAGGERTREPRPL
jgi:mannose-6-phosphate isomerase-like protein (cupin superfamily)